MHIVGRGGFCMHKLSKQGLYHLVIRHVISAAAVRTLDVWVTALGYTRFNELRRLVLDGHLQRSQTCTRLHRLQLNCGSSWHRHCVDQSLLFLTACLAPRRLGVICVEKTQDMHAQFIALMLQHVSHFHGLDKLDRRPAFLVEKGTIHCGLRHEQSCNFQTIRRDSQVKRRITRIRSRHAGTQL